MENNENKEYNWDKVMGARKFTHHALIENELLNLKLNKKFKVINVVGTNGKGSVSNFISQGLIDKGYKVGVFTSPHLRVPNERIQINNVNITDEEFFAIYDGLNKHMHFFAYLLLAALKHFDNEECDFVILEAGIGGQRDTTNLIDGDFGILTSVGIDHVNLLGSSIKKIAKNKAGIMNEGMTFFIGTNNEEITHKIFKKRAKKNGANLIEINNEAPTYPERNKKLAAGFLDTIGVPFTDFVDVPGRSQVFENNGLTTIFDVAHNMDGVKASLEAIKDEYDQIVFSFNKSKEVDLSLFPDKKLFYYKVDKRFRDFEGVEEIKDINEFYDNQDKKTLYIGSFYLIGKLI